MTETGPHVKVTPADGYAMLGHGPGSHGRPGAATFRQALNRPARGTASPSRLAGGVGRLPLGRPLPDPRVSAYLPTSETKGLSRG